MEHKWEIDMFDGVNYQTWNTIIEIFFLKEYLWSDINGTSLRSLRLLINQHGTQKIKTLGLFSYEVWRTLKGAC
jgi:hypothetical protein